MQRQSTISEIASHLGITENAVNECIDSGLFLATYHQDIAGHRLDKQECEWAWLQYTAQVAANPDVSHEALSRAVAYVKSLRVLILEEGSYHGGIQLMKAVDHDHEDSPFGLHLLIGVLVFLLIYISFT